MFETIFKFFQSKLLYYHIILINKGNVYDICVAYNMTCADIHVTRV